MKDCLSTELALRIDLAFDREWLRLQAQMDTGVQLVRECDPSRLLDLLCADARDLIASSHSLVAISSKGQRRYLDLLETLSRLKLKLGFSRAANVMKGRCSVYFEG